MVQKYKETKLRTIVKSIILRIIVFCIITVAVYLITDSYTKGFEVALLDVGIELCVHYMYERIWQKIGWGIVIKEIDDPEKTFTVLPIPEDIILGGNQQVIN